MRCIGVVAWLETTAVMAGFGTRLGWCGRLGRRGARGVEERALRALLTLGGAAVVGLAMSRSEPFEPCEPSAAGDGSPIPASSAGPDVDGGAGTAPSGS